MTTTETRLHAYDVRDPAQLILDIADQGPLVMGSAHLALVRDVSTDQRVLRVDRLRLPAEIVDYTEGRDELERVATAWSLPPEPARPRHTPVLVIVRPGLCVFGPNEGAWFLAARYADLDSALWSVSDMLVTEHGWLDSTTNEAGLTPRAEVPASS